MAINAIQFQKGSSLEDFMKQYGTEEQCEQAFAQARWPDGFCCPRCAHTTACGVPRFHRTLNQIGHHKIWRDGGVFATLPSWDFRRLSLLAS